MRKQLLLVAILGVRAAQAQQAPPGFSGAAAQANLNALVQGLPTVVPTGNTEGLKGSPYADDRWLMARLHLRNNVVLAPMPLKYDVLNRHLLMKPLNRPNDSLQLSDQLVVSFDLDQPATSLAAARTRRFRRFAEAPIYQQRAEYVEVLHEGRYTLLKRYAKSITKANFQQAYNTDQRYDEIEDKDQYFLLRPDQKLVPLKLTLKMLEAAAPELAAALKAAPAVARARTDVEWGAVLDTVDAR
ncbi:hypothetical protein CDA63_14645 [Hymenobacter amundsenii]|uniref:Uncharacterized protein n=1 Tax=Hymenobacter amundsenii TaxID=2006685 RepID=A0A246FIG3_9BACT|nr:hypothetical protein [Hymenobacter amundsenii]OWP62322.1 hypothetical protein CDA63_14645 [Hymenobacter amundsenii]